MQSTGTSVAVKMADKSEATMRILVLDDSEIDRQRLIRLCRSAGLRFEATEVSTLAGMHDALSKDGFDIVFIDHMLAGEDGLQAIDHLMGLPGQTAAAIMIAGEGRLDIAVEAMRRGCSDYLTKGGLTVEAIQKSIATSIERRMLALTLQEERSRRLEFERSIRAYANTCSAEMRSLLAATLRRVRKLREHATGEAFSIDLADVETHIDRLWTAMPAFPEAWDATIAGPGRVGRPRLS